MSYVLRPMFPSPDIPLVSGNHYFFGTSSELDELVGAFNRTWCDKFVRVPQPRYSARVSRFHAILGWSGDSGMLTSFSPKETSISLVDRGDDDRIYRTLDRIAETVPIGSSDRDFYKACLGRVYYPGEFASKLNSAKSFMMQEDFAFLFNEVTEYEIVREDS